ncbi:MAG: efflux RND transporter permease subunit [Gammaproteobacteria bacterium]|nr:efflux RND transporter permease subunit [Gammaproteobacteria bacterium]
MTERDANDDTPTTLFTRNPHLLILTIVMILVAGASALLTLPRIEDPRITTRNATIITPYPGATAERVEALVSKKIEDRLRELAEIKTIESTSRNGISVVNIELQDWVGADDNEQIFSQVRDRLDAAAADLPAAAGIPEFDDMRGAVAFSLIYALAWRDDAIGELGILKRVAEQLADRLRNLAGTEQVVMFGVADEEIRVDVDAAEAAALGLTPAAVAQRIATADARRSAGTLRAASRDLPLEVDGALDSVQRIAAVPLADNGRGGLVHVGDIAAVSKQWQDPPEQIALHDGRRSVLIAVRTETDIRLDRWAEQARATAQTFAADLDGALTLDSVFDQSRYTGERLGGLAGNLLAGAGVVVLVVWVMMGWRPALIVGAALPLSAGLSLFGLTLFGEQIHQMTIFGMIIAIGLLIDNAIVMTDQVVARRRAGDPPTLAVGAAIRHLFAPLAASTLTTILGFMPVFLLPGNVGDFVGPIAIAVVLALIASFALAMTVIPALAGLLADAERRSGRRWWRDGVRSARVSAGYRQLLALAVRRPRLTLLASAALPLTGFVLAGGLGMQFFPPADRDQIEIQVWMPAGTAIAHTHARLRAIEQTIRDDAAVRHVTWVAGASSPPVYYNQLREQDNNPRYARGVIALRDSAAAKRFEAVLQDRLTEHFGDAQVIVRAFGQGPPIRAPIGLRVFGPDADRLRELGERLRALLHRQPAVTHTQASIQGGEPKLWLDADEHQARLAGLTLGGIANQFQAALDGRVGGRVLEDLEDLPVRIRYADGDRRSVDAISTLRLGSAGSDDWIPANALGSVRLSPALQGVTRRNGERVNEINGYLRQGALPIEVTAAVMTEIDAGALQLPPGYRIELAGDSAEQQRAVGQLLTYVPLLATLMIATLVLSFRSFALAGLIGVVALFSVGLGMLSLWAGGYPLGFNPLIGSAGLIGVAINGSIVVLAAIRANPSARAGDDRAIIAETLGATRHIVSTTLTTVAGFMPLLLFSGGDFWPPLAIVIAGGVGLSGMLSLLLTPAAYRLLARHVATPQAARAVLPRAGAAMR